MSDAWGTLTGPMRSGGAVHGHSDPATAGDNVLTTPPGADENSAAVDTNTVETDPALVNRFRRYATWCACLAMAIGCAGLIGWFTGIRSLTTLRPGWSAMKVNAALALIAAGAALLLNALHHGERGPARQAARLCAVFMIAMASATLTEFVFGVDLGIDQLLVVEPASGLGAAHPGRIAPLAIPIFEILGICLLTMTSTKSLWRMLASTLALLVIVACMAILLGYVLGASELYTATGRFSPIAANTALGSLLLGSGIVFTNLPAGPLRRLTSPYLGGVMLREMLPVIVALTTAILWLRLMAQSAGLFISVEFGVASAGVAIMISMAVILIWYAGVLDRLDGARRRGDEQLRKLQATLDQSRARSLEAANREFQEFFYSMSHVLRAPLRAIHGYAQITLDDLGDTLGSAGQRLLGMMQSSTEEMGELLDGILAFLRLGWQTMTIVPVNMRRHVDTAIGHLHSKTAGRTVEFAIGDLPDAQADAGMVQQIWLTLIDNAIKFTATRNAARIVVGAQRDGDRTIYFVKDNGAGFDMQYAGKLFGVFQRLHDTTQFPGTGIGLAIVNRIVARHGGHVWAEGKSDEGAAFYFSLPITEKNHA